jgi:hypothetical protein
VARALRDGLDDCVSLQSAMMTPPLHPRYGCFDPITGRSTMTSPRFASPLQMHQAMSRRSILTTGGALLAAGASSPALAQAVLGDGKTPPHLRFLQPATSSKQAGYSHVVEATVPGRIIFIAGQMGSTAVATSSALRGISRRRRRKPTRTSAPRSPPPAAASSTS